MKSPNCGLPAECGGYVLSAAPSTHFAVGYSTVVGEEDEVNSPPPRVRLSVISSPSPLRPRRILNSFDDDGRRSTRGKKILCSSEGPPPPAQCSTVCYLTPSPPPLLCPLHLPLLYRFLLSRCLTSSGRADYNCLSINGLE